MIEIEIGNYSLECDIDPTIQNNASSKKIPIEDIGFIYNCVFNQKQALIRSVEAIRDVYPDSKIRIFSDGGLDYSYLEDACHDHLNDVTNDAWHVLQSHYIKINRP